MTRRDTKRLFQFVDRSRIEFSLLVVLAEDLLYLRELLGLVLLINEAPIISVLIIRHDRTDLASNRGGGGRIQIVETTPIAGLCAQQTGATCRN